MQACPSVSAMSSAVRYEAGYWSVKAKGSRSLFHEGKVHLSQTVKRNYILNLKITRYLSGEKCQYV